MAVDISAIPKTVMDLGMKPDRVKLLAFIQGLCFDFGNVEYNLSFEAFINSHSIVNENDFDNKNHIIRNRHIRRDVIFKNI